MDKKFIQELNRVAVEWKTIPREGNEAAVEQLKQKVYKMAYKIFLYYDDGSESMLDRYIKVLETYRPEASSLSYYLKSELKYQKIDNYRSDSRHASREVSMNEMFLDDEGEYTLEQIIEDKNAQDPVKQFELNSSLELLTAQILSFDERHHCSNQSRIQNMWYRLFFTENITDATMAIALEVTNEKALFRAMWLEYLDYYMSLPCRTLREIRRTNLKIYEEILHDYTEEEAKKELRVPLEARVMLAYLEAHQGIKVQASARSNHHKKYKELCESIRKEMEKC